MVLFQADQALVPLAALEFGSHEQQGQRLGPAFRPPDSLACLGRGERAKRDIDHALRIDQTSDASCQFVGDIEPLGEAVDPIGAIRREPLGSRRSP